MFDIVSVWHYLCLHVYTLLCFGVQKRNTHTRAHTSDAIVCGFGCGCVSVSVNVLVCINFIVVYWWAYYSLFFFNFKCAYACMHAMHACMQAFNLNCDNNSNSYHHFHHQQQLQQKHTIISKRKRTETETEIMTAN